MPSTEEVIRKLQDELAQRRELFDAVTARREEREETINDLSTTLARLHAADARDSTELRKLGTKINALEDAIEALRFPRAPQAVSDGE